MLDWLDGMTARRLLVPFCAVATSTGCLAEDPEPTPEPSASKTIIDDVCDWWEPSDLSVTAVDALVTPAGIAVVCEQPGADASSLIMIDPTTLAKRVVYDVSDFAVYSMLLADPSTLLLLGRRAELYVVPIDGSSPPQRISANTTNRHIEDPTIVGGDVYYASAEYPDNVPTYAVEKVSLSGGPDQTPVVVTSLPVNVNYIIGSSNSLHLFGQSDSETIVMRLDLGATHTLTTLMTRPRGPYEVMGFYGNVANRVLWQDEGTQPSRLVEIVGDSFIDTDAPCPLWFGARVIGNEVVQVSARADDPCPGFVAMNFVDGTVRRAALEYGFQDSYSIVGAIGDRVFATETNIDRTRLVESTLVADRTMARTPRAAR
jgi:hypothetical protein